ncbi:hypothetical protein [uncultured Brachyspira sp.]|uniref:hypothetical protein n=1 Tax=uncultured Brachyspira sp. TaxID=221953 RepID=UPI0025FA0FD5|nr:hypothetical protein [uncultured Brachyspira sp.]
MKNNIISSVKSKKFMIISAVIALISLFIIAVKVLGLQYYIFYIMHNIDDMDDIIEGLLKISVSSLIILSAFIIFKKINLKSDTENSDNYKNNGKEEIKHSLNKSKINMPVIAAISAVSITALIIFLLRFSGMHYILYNLDDIAEDILKLVTAAVLIVLCIVFAKKLIEKL